MFDETRRISTMIYEILKMRGRNSNFPTRSGTIGDTIEKKSKVTQLRSEISSFIIPRLEMLRNFSEIRANTLRVYFNDRQK